jgi:hypothetical protein
MQSGQTMAADTKTAKADPAPKSEPKNEPKSETAAKDKKTSGEASSKTESKAESGKAADAAPAGYSRGEGQKPVSAAYRENWNAIFGKKGAKRRKG